MSDPKKIKIARTAPDALRVLWREKTFLKAKTVKDIKEELAKRGYNFEDGSLMMALKRAKFLTRHGTFGMYSYIQKYPFDKEV